MSERPPLSAVIITLNAERHLARVLASLDFCHELLVLDSGSTDRTLELARAGGARVLSQRFLGFGAQKQRAVELARHDWVLVVDADEVLTAEARLAILALPRQDPRQAWRLRRRTFIGEREVRWGVWSPDWSLRLFNRTTARFNDQPVHESVVAGGPVADLPGALLHYSYRDYADVFVRMGGYARLKAAEYRRRGRRAGAATLALRAIWGFLRSYVLKLGVLDGVAGVVVALSLSIDMVVALAIAGDAAAEPAAAPPPAGGGTPGP
jgi:(heptosyl)LPS beta-1,4-glucosyltransferase